MSMERPPIPEPPPAIVLASFGTTRTEALGGIINIKRRVERAFPDHAVRLAFTSNQVRKVWQKRRDDPAWRQAHPQTPPEVYEVQGPLAAIANLQDQGHRRVAVQSLHIFAGEEYADLQAMVRALAGIKTIKPKWTPFASLTLGRPALGQPGEDPPHAQDIARASAALAADIELAQAKGAALVYMGHGNPTFSTGAYAELARRLRQDYPQARIFIGVVEGFPDLEQLLEELQAAGVGRILLKPLMIVAGDHAQNDMCGSEESWKIALVKAGHQVECVMSGLGEMDPFADLYVENLRDALAGR